MGEACIRVPMLAAFMLPCPHQRLVAMLAAMLELPMAAEKAKAMSIKLPMDAIESARIVSAYRGRTMTGVKGNIPRPAHGRDGKKGPGNRTHQP